MLSAQCTDKQVNKVTPAVFARFPDVKSMAEADVAELYPLVKSCGFKSKASNVVMSTAFHIPAIAVDTHVFRVSNRLGLVDAPDVLKTEMQLRALIPQDRWSDAHHWLIFHGRRVCKAQHPLCGECTLRPWCKKYNSETE